MEWMKAAIGGVVKSGWKHRDDDADNTRRLTRYEDKTGCDKDEMKKSWRQTATRAFGKVRQEG